MDDTAAAGVLGSRWILLCAVWTSFAVSSIDRLAWANVSTSYAQCFALLVAALGSFFSAFYIGCFFTNAISGFAADWFCGRRMETVALMPLGAFTWTRGRYRALGNVTIVIDVGAYCIIRDSESAAAASTK